MDLGAYKRQGLEGEVREDRPALGLTSQPMEGRMVHRYMLSYLERLDKEKSKKLNQTKINHIPAGRRRHLDQQIKRIEAIIQAKAA